MTCWRLTSVAKNTCFAFQRQFFLKLFQFSLELFMTIHFLSQLKLTQTLHVTLYKLHFYTFSPPNFKKKVWVLISSPHISCFELYLCCCFVFRYGFVSIFEIVLVWIVEVLFFCKLVSVDRFIYYHVLVSLR